MKQIHKTNLLKIDWIRESGITGFVWICKSIVLRICEDSYDLSDLLNLLKMRHETNPQNKSFEN